MKRGFFCGGVMVALAGCAELQTPQAAAPKAAVAAQVAQDPPAPKPAIAQAQATAQNPAARHFLSTVSTAFDQNPNITPLRTRLAAQQANAQNTAQVFRPELTASTRSFEDGVALEATQPLIDFGKRSARVARIKADAKADRLRIAQERNRLLDVALRAVLEHNLAQARSAILKRKIADFEKAGRAAKRLAGLGLLTAADVRLAEVEGRTAQVELLRAQNDQTVAQQRWIQIVGNQPVPKQLDPHNLRVAARVDTAERAIRSATANGLELRDLAVQSEALTAEETIIRKRNTPTINASAITVLGNSNQSSRAGLTLSYPIFNRDRGDDLVQNQTTQQALASEQTARSGDIGLDIKRLTTITATSRALVQAQRDSVGLLRLRVRDLEIQLESGLASYTDLISARSEVFDMELDILQNIFDQRRADADILLLTAALIP